jgi:hypothetical protein
LAAFLWLGSLTIALFRIIVSEGAIAVNQIILFLLKGFIFNTRCFICDNRL